MGQVPRGPLEPSGQRWKGAVNLLAQWVGPSLVPGAAQWRWEVRSPGLRGVGGDPSRSEWEGTEGGEEVGGGIANRSQDGQIVVPSAGIKDCWVGLEAGLERGTCCHCDAGVR